MSQAYQVGQITAKQIDSAFVLARATTPMLDLESWRRFCKEVRDGWDRPGPAPASSDVLVVANPPGYVQGLAICAVRADLAHGQVLDVSVFTVASAADEIGVADELLRCLKARARILGCRGLRVWNWGEDGWSRSLQTHHDRHPDGVLTVDPDPAQRN